jgi:hypothetical protein
MSVSLNFDGYECKNEVPKIGQNVPVSSRVQGSGFRVQERGKRASPYFLNPEPRTLISITNPFEYGTWIVGAHFAGLNRQNTRL